MTGGTFFKIQTKGGLFSLLLMSCNASEEVPATLTATDTISTASHEPMAEEATLDTTVFELPFELTNENIDLYFDEEADKPLSALQLETLGLQSLETCEGCDVYVLGEVPLSETVKTRLVFRNNDWNEWKMWLVSYDSDDQKLGEVKILYGDSVEGLSETICVVEKDKIRVQKFDYGFEEYEESGIEEIYTLTEAGVFLKISETDLPR